MFVCAVHSKLDSAFNAISEDRVKFRFHIFFLAERLRLELRNPLSRVERLAIFSNTIMGPFHSVHYTLVLFSINSFGSWSKHSSVDKTSWYSFLNTASSNSCRSLQKIASQRVSYSFWDTLSGRGLLPFPDIGFLNIKFGGRQRSRTPSHF